MNDELNGRLARLSPEKRALLQLRMKQGAVACLAPAIRRIEPNNPCPLSFAQQRLWFLDRIESNAGLYNIPWVAKLSGALNVAALQRTLNALIVRHESLRTVFTSRGDTPAQTISNFSEISITKIDLHALSEVELTAEVDRHLAIAIHKPFDLTKDVMIRALLLQTAPNEHVLALVFHHIAVDGWSLSILTREMSELYNAYAVGEEPTLPDNPIQYADYAVRQRQEFHGARLERCLDYWKRQLAGAPELLELPTFQQRPETQSFSGAFEIAEIPAELTSRLKKLCERESATLFMVLLSSFYILLARYSKQSDLIVGSPIAGRTNAEVENVVGCFVNSLALRADLSGNPTFLELLKRVKKTALDGFTHQDMPLEKLVEELQPRRNQSHSPLYQVMFALQNTPDESLRLSGLSVTPHPLPWKVAKFDLTLFIKEQGGVLKATMEYCTELFKPEFVARMMSHLQTLMKNIVRDPSRCIWDHSLLSPDEQDQQLAWSNVSDAQPVTKRIQDIFEERVQETPDAVALVIGDNKLSYKELNRRSNQLANFLQTHGVGPDVLVGVCMERSADLIVSLLAILKAGGAFLPLDASYPAERLAFMLRDTRSPLLLVDSRLRSKLPACDAEMIDIRGHELFSNESEANPTSNVTPENLAYVMYTSGSTGRPKGVCVPHRGVVRLVIDPNYMSLRRDDVLLQFAPVSFDASTLEIWGALLNGAQLVIYPEGMSSLKDIGEVLRRHKVTTLWLTAGLFHQMIDDHIEALRGVRQLLAGGDALSVPHVKKAVESFRGCRVINGYGPTENTTFSTCHTVVPDDTHATSIPIGSPINSTQVFVLDRNMNAVPAGVSGELYVGGEGLARGYHNRPELTAQKFVPHPFKRGARLYRTGDSVRFLPDGTLEFLGRLDSQVKIRGFRIELGEIEAALAQHSAVREALVIARATPSGDKRLIAYAVVESPRSTSPDELAGFMKSKLPDYMVPSAIVPLESFPLTANGKVNRDALPEPETGVSSAVRHTRPWLPIQIQLLRIWETLLGVKEIGLRDDFFSLGGHSLLAAKMVDRIERECGIKIPLSALFSAPTIERLSDHLLKARKNEAEADIIPVQTGRGRQPFFFLDGDLQGGGFYCLSLARQLGPDQPFFALRPTKAINGRGGSIEEQARQRLTTLRSVKPTGPYMLGGFCIDALVAYEMACQLQREGQTVNLLVLVDPPSHPLGLRLAAQALAGVSHCAGLRHETTLRHFKRCLSLQDIVSMDSAHRSRYVREKLKRVMANTFSSRRETPVICDEGKSRSDKRTQPDVLTAQLWSSILYRPRRFAGPVSLFIAENLMDYSTGSHWQWKRRADCVDVYPIPGEHLGLITRNVEILGRELKACISKAAGCATSGRVSECLLSAS